MTDSFKEKTTAIKNIFAPLSIEQRYQKLIEMGRELPPFPEECKTPDRIVSGCQSSLYLLCILSDGKLFFKAYSDALISAGLSAILIQAYSGEDPETILTTPPDFIKELGIAATLSANRSNGLAHIHLKIKQEALQALCNQKSI